jgi:hypothetical protein
MWKSSNSKEDEHSSINKVEEQRRQGMRACQHTLVVNEKEAAVLTLDGKHSR